MALMMLQTRSLGRAFLFAALLLSLNALASDTPTPQIEQYEGVARSPEGELLYREKHEVEYRNGRVFKALSRYLSPEGRLIGELSSDFSDSTYLPRYRFRNLNIGVEEGVDCCTGSELEVFHQGKRKKLAFTANWVSGQGFHYLAKDRLDQVDQGKRQEFKFLIPSKMSAYDFRIRSGGRDPKHPDRERVILEIDQWFFRLFAPRIVAHYDTKTRRLMRYEGLSNLEDSKGNVPKVVIDYTY